MAIISKVCKSDKLEPHNSQKLCFTNIQHFCSNFVGCESFLELNSPDILILCQTNLNDFTGKRDSFRHMLKSSAQLVCMKVQAHTFSDPPLEFDQDQAPLTNQGWL